jgi:putative colanic acid biosynthesis acetyltransferase WcaF
MENKPHTDLSRFNPKAFDRGASSLKFFVWHWVNVLFFVSPFFPFSGMRCALLRLFGAKVGKGVVISKPGVNIKFPWRLSIGNHVWIGENAWLYNLDKLTIGNHVNIAQGAMLLTGNHNFKSSTFETIYGPITIEDGVFIGAKAIVCPNVICKTESVLAAGSVATSNLEAYGIYQGNPAMFKKERVIEE